MTGIMKLIFNQPRGKWPDELIKVVWSHNTKINRFYSIQAIVW
jgi:hypothetical protein